MYIYMYVLLVFFAITFISSLVMICYIFKKLKLKNWFGLSHASRFFPVISQQINTGSCLNYLLIESIMIEKCIGRE